MTDQPTIHPTDLDTPTTRCVGIRFVPREEMEGWDRDREIIILHARVLNADGSLGHLYRQVANVYPETLADKPALIGFLRKAIDERPEGAPA